MFGLTDTVVLNLWAVVGVFAVMVSLILILMLKGVHRKVKDDTIKFLKECNETLEKMLENTQSVNATLRKMDSNSQELIAIKDDLIDRKTEQVVISNLKHVYTLISFRETSLMLLNEAEKRISNSGDGSGDEAFWRITILDDAMEFAINLAIMAKMKKFVSNDSVLESDYLEKAFHSAASIVRDNPNHIITVTDIDWSYWPNRSKEDASTV